MGWQIINSENSDVVKETAQQYHAQGLNVIPLKDRQPLTKWTQWQSKRQSKEEFEGLNWNAANGFAVICGTKLDNGLFFGVIDYDVKKNVSEEAKANGKKILELLRTTQRERTPSGGEHWIFLCYDKPKNNSAYRDDIAIEIIGENKLVIMAPSLGYERLNDNLPAVIQNLEHELQDAILKAGIKLSKNETKTGQAWFNRSDLTGKAYTGENPPCIGKILCGTTEGSRNEFAIRLCSYFVNFRKIDTEKAWKKIRDWNKWNEPPLREPELRGAFKSAVEHGYVYGCNDSILASLCDKNNCEFAKKEAEKQAENKAYDADVEAMIQNTLNVILESDNQLKACEPHLNTVIVGEEETKKPAFVLLTGSKYSEPEFKQLLLFKATEGVGKSTLVRALTKGYKTKEVARFSETALDYVDLEDYEILSLKELGHMDMEKQGVSRIKFLSSDDRGYTVVITGKDKETGELTAKEYKIPCITVVSTTTRLSLDSQFERRAWLFGMDESPEQTERVAKWKAENEKERAEVLLGIRKITGVEFSQEVLRRFIAQIKPVKVVIPFSKTLSEVFGYDVLRVRGDIDKLFVFVRLYAGLNKKRLKKLNGDVYMVTPEICLEALHIAEKAFIGMLSKMDKRAKNILTALKEIKGVEERTWENGEQHEEPIRYDVRGAEIDKNVREQIARKIGRSEKTVRDYLTFLENSGYLSSDQRKPKTFTLLYDVAEIEGKLSGISAKFKSDDVLMEKMAKEAQEWLDSTLEIKVAGDPHKNLWKKEPDVRKNYDNFLGGSPRETISNLESSEKQACPDEKGLKHRLNQKLLISQKEKQSKPKLDVSAKAKADGLIACPICESHKKAMWFADKQSLDAHIRRFHGATTDSKPDYIR